MAYFSILGNKEKNEGGDITAEAEKMYTNLFQFQQTILYNYMFYKFITYIKYRNLSLQPR